jgi:hypothetical protein
MYALLRPLRHRYIGQYLTAVLVLLAIYGGGVVVLWPFLASGDPNPPPRVGVVAASAVLCLAVPPLYARRWRAGAK